MGLVVGWLAGCARWRGPRRWMGQQVVGEVTRGLNLFGGASSETLQLQRRR